MDVGPVLVRKGLRDVRPSAKAFKEVFRTIAESLLNNINVTSFSKEENKRVFLEKVTKDLVLYAQKLYRDNENFLDATDTSAQDSVAAVMYV